MCPLSHPYKERTGDDTMPSPELMAALADLMMSTVDEYNGYLDRAIWGDEGLHSRIGKL